MLTTFNGKKLLKHHDSEKTEKINLAPSLGATITELWPEQARRKLAVKGLTQEQVADYFSRVVFPENPTYNSYRFFFQLEVSELPLFIVVITKYEDATKLLDFITLYNLRVRVINGRHNSAIQDPDVYADISKLDKIKFGKTLQVQGGATQGQVYTQIPLQIQHNSSLHFPGAKINHQILSFALHPIGKDLAFAGGTAGSVGVAGITTCGGIGTLKRTLGLTIDSVISFKIAIPPRLLAKASKSPEVRKITEELLTQKGEARKTTKDIELLIEKDDKKHLDKSKALENFYEKSGTSPVNSSSVDFCELFLKVRAVEASDKKNRDLFWALRGGQASNFGVVLKMKFKTIKVHKTITYSVSFDDWSVAKDVLDFWQETAPKRNFRFNEDISLFNVNTLNRDDKTLKREMGIGIAGIYVVDFEIEGGMLHEGKMDYKKINANYKKINANYKKISADYKSFVKKELKPYLKWGGKINVEVSTYQDTIRQFAAHRTYKPFSSGRTFFKYEKIDSRTIAKGLEYIRDLGIPGIHIFGMELMGGAIKLVSPKDTAFYPRNATFFAEVFSYWDSALYTCSTTEWVKDLFNKVYIPGKDNVYIGFPINGLPNHLEAYFGKNKKRLQRVKSKYDPLNIMKHPTGINALLSHKDEARKTLGF